VTELQKAKRRVKTIRAIRRSTEQEGMSSTAQLKTEPRMWRRHGFAVPTPVVAVRFPPLP